MRNDYFGARFLASEGLKSYGDEYYKYVNIELVNEISKDNMWYLSFLNSIENLSEDKFKEVFNYTITADIVNQEEVNLNYLDLLKRKIKVSETPDFKDWAEQFINELQSKSILKIN
jgi:hypothetical protein